MRDIGNRLLWSVLLLLLQGLLFNHIHLFGYVTPMIYVYVLFLLPAQSNRITWLLWGFTVGLLSDFFTHTPGLGAASMTCAAMFAPGILRLFSPKDQVDDFVPGYRTLGQWKYVWYVSFVVMLHQASYLLLEMFSFFHAVDMLYTFLGSSFLTVLLICLLEKLRATRP